MKNTNYLSEGIFPKQNDAYYPSGRSREKDVPAAPLIGNTERGGTLLPTFPPKVRFPDGTVKPISELTEEEYHTLFPQETPSHYKQTDNTEDKFQPLSQSMLHNRLEQLKYNQRQQEMQDDFTTTLYGKPDYHTEIARIEKQLTHEPPKPDEHGISFRNKNASSGLNSSSDRELTPQPVWDAIENYKQENPDEYEEQIRRMHPESLPRGKMDRWGDIAADTVQGFFRQGKNWAQHTADKFKDWLGGKEEKPSGSAPKQENQPRTATLEEWETQDKKFQDEKNPRCNTCLGKMLKSRDIDIPFGVDMNHIISFMEKSDDWKTLPRREDGGLDHSTANKLAQEGETVVATLKNEPTASKSEAHGHGVLLTGNSQMHNSSAWQENVPEVTGSRGRGNPDVTKPLSYHFQKKDEDNIEYHVYQPGKGKNAKDN